MMFNHGRKSVLNLSKTAGNYRKAVSEVVDVGRHWVLFERRVCWRCRSHSGPRAVQSHINSKGSSRI